MDKREPKKIRRVQKLVGEHGFLHVRVGTDLRGSFIEYCRQQGVGASEVVREVIQAVLAGTWMPPALKKPEKGTASRRKKAPAQTDEDAAPAAPRKKSRG